MALLMHAGSTSPVPGSEPSQEVHLNNATEGAVVVLFGIGTPDERFGSGVRLWGNLIVTCTHCAVEGGKSL